MPPLAHTRHLLLADDDKDDTTLFHEVLEELHLSVQLTIMRDGEQLMYLLRNAAKPLPDILFLDLNMPRINGYDCLSEIRQIERLNRLPVIIFTTSHQPEVVSLLYKIGAQYYIRKPNNYDQLKKLIHLALTLTDQTGIFQPPREKFILSSQLIRNENC